MITNALQHLPYCLQYLELLRHKKVRASHVQLSIWAHTCAANMSICGWCDQIAHSIHQDVLLRRSWLRLPAAACHETPLWRLYAAWRMTDAGQIMHTPCANKLFITSTGEVASSL